jgi:hypothetical protein
MDFLCMFYTMLYLLVRLLLCRKVLLKLIVKQRNILLLFRRPLTKHDDSSKNYPDSLAYENASLKATIAY